MNFALIIHGDEDKTVPLEFGIKLYDIANQPKKIEIFEGAKHTNLYEFGGLDSIINFLESL